MPKSPGRWILVAAAAAYLASGFYQVAPDESAVALRFGQAGQGDVLPGMHWNLPWPMGSVIVEQTATNFIMPVGYRFRPASGEDTVSDLWMTGDTNIATVRLTVQYRIRNLTEFVVTHEEPRELVRRAGERVLAQLLVEEKAVDGVLTTRRNAVPGAVAAGIQKLLDKAGVGVEVQSISIQELAPPVQGGVRAAFQDVQNAKSDRERLIHEARASASQTLAEAAGEADRIRSRSQAEHRSALERARGRSERFKALAEQHAASPQLTEQRLFLETMEKVLGKTKNFVVEPGTDGTVKLRVLQ